MVSRLCLVVGSHFVFFNRSEQSTWDLFYDRTRSRNWKSKIRCLVWYLGFVTLKLKRASKTNRLKLETKAIRRSEWEIDDEIDAEGLLDGRWTSSPVENEEHRNPLLFLFAGNPFDLTAHSTFTHKKH